MGAFYAGNICSAVMKVVKAAKFSYEASRDLGGLFEDFRLMCNDAIRLALLYEKEHNGEPVRDRYALIRLAYSRLKEYGLHTHYILSACEVAFAAYSDKRRRSHPYFKRAFLKIGSQAYRLDYLLLRIPTSPGRYIYLTLNGSSYHRLILADGNLKRGSVTINRHVVVIAFSKSVPAASPTGRLGIDVNERNVTWSDTLRHSRKEDISEVAELRARYSDVRARIASRCHKDRRVTRRLLAKYGRRERDRVLSILHEVSKRIVDHAECNGLGIVMEKLTGIRKLYRKGNGQGSAYRGRMNSWTFAEFQKQVEYKAAWIGVPVTYVSPRNTSRRCPECGSILRRLSGRMLRCPLCKLAEDRDVIASRNLMACVVPQARPSE